MSGMYVSFMGCNFCDVRTARKIKELIGKINTSANEFHLFS